MDETGDFDGFEADVSGVEQALGDAGAMARAFQGELFGMQRALDETSKGLGDLSTGFSSGLRKAFDGLVFDGMKLSDALTTVATAMVDTAYSAAVSPVTSHLGGLLSDGVNAAVAGLMPFAKGGAFSQGRVMPFARGGIVSQATAFPMHGGTGLMGEAGPEAIMPLARGPDGRLGVAAQGGSTVNVTMNIATPDAPSFQRSQAQIAAQMARVLGRGQRNR